MNKNRLIFLLAIFTLAVFFSHGYAQQDEYDPTSAVRSALEAQVHSMFGIEYREVGFYVMDSLIGKTLPPQDEEITDPYGTLSGCILFEAYKWTNGKANYDSLISGVFKNGQIIWHTDPIKFGAISELFATLDLNHDGEVDILSLCTDGQDYGREVGPEFLWIFSWNGTTGRIINDIDPLTGQSSVVSDGRLEFYETQEDSVKKFIGRITQDFQDNFPYIQTATLPCVTYGWNGFLYGFWPTVHQVTGTEHLPANLLTVTARSSASFDGDFYHYYYTWTNLSNSRQQMSEIWFAHLDPTMSASGPQNWESHDSSLIGRRDWFLFDKFRSSMIKPGQTVSGFEAVSASIPAIIDYYVQGNRPHPRTICHTTLLSIEDERNDMLTNSVHGYTVGPRNPPSPFNKLNFLDTLKSYINQSRSLGWINNQPSADAYTNLFDSAKAQLQRNDNRLARYSLDTVMAHAVVDSSGVLSSEAFALIYFNSQYLFAQIPPPPQYSLTVSSSGGGSVSKSPDAALYDSASAVSLTAIPSTAYLFNSWSGDESGSGNPLSIVMDRNKSITATFIPNTVTITASAGINGSITPSGAVSVTYGASQSFTMTPNTGYHIDSVIVDGMNQGAVLSYTFSNVAVAHTIAVTFASIASTITNVNPGMTLTGSGPFKMTVTGNNFTSNSVVYWNGSPRQTVVISSTRLQASILGKDDTTAGTATITVVDENNSLSNAASFSVLNTLPFPVRPVLECVTVNGNTYTAWFGYKNDNNVGVFIPAGSKNKFTPNPQDRGQTTVFLPGRKVKVFSVVFNGSNLVWSLNGRTSTASSSSTRCSQ